MAIMDNPYGALAFLDRASGISRPGPTLPGVGFGQGGDGGDDGGDNGESGGSCAGCTTPKITRKQCVNPGGVDNFCEITWLACIDGECTQYQECAPASECPDCGATGGGSVNGAVCSAGTLIGW